MDHWMRDLRYALRTLRRSPLFTAVAVLTLALGIGVNAAIFTFVDAVLLAPPPIEKPQEVVAVFSSWQEEPWATSSYADYLDLRDQNKVFSGLTGTSIAVASLQQAETSDYLLGELVTGDYFQVLGVPLAQGRGLSAEDDELGAPRSVVLGHGLWQRQFAGDPDIVGSTVRLSGEPYDVVGVAASSFGGLLPGVVSDFWLPSIRVGDVEPAGQINSVAGDPGETRLERRGYRWLWLRGRLADGVTPEAAEAQLATIMARVAEQHPITNDGVTARTRPLNDVRVHPEVDSPLQAAAVVLMAAVGLVLLVVCANLANLLLARAQGRRREIAIRLALGAQRGRLVRQLLVEGLALSAAGGLLAVVLAHWTTRLILAFRPPIPFSVQLNIGVDSRVVAYCALLALGSALFFALVPALQSTRPDLIPALKDLSGGGEGRQRLFSLRNGLVVAQVAVSTVLLVAAALLVRALGTAQHTDVGFAPQRVATVALQLGLLGYDREGAETLLRNLKEQAISLPGVDSVSLASRVPFDINTNFRAIYPETMQLDAEHPGFSTDVGWVDEHYFETLGVSLVAGRNFTSADDTDSPTVAIVNHAMARRYWSTAAGAVGQRIRTGSAEGESVLIVGVSADTKVRSVGETPRPMVHFARGQRPTSGAFLLARSSGPEAASLLPQLRMAARRLDSKIAFADSNTLEGMMAVTLFPVRMGAMLLGLFALLALALATVGLYGVIAMSVLRRYREIGVRVALGARPSMVARHVASSGMALVALGALLGAGIAALASQRLSGVLYGTSPLDPIAFGGALLALLFVALCANAGPAWRAARLDVVTALDSE